MEAFLKGQTSGFSSTRLKKAEGATSSKKTSTPWVEKYRPKSVDEVAHQDEVVMVLKKSLEGADLPNLLFYGPPGTGKTSTILAVARQLYGHDLFKSRVLELNASDERGIQVVREKVKNFAQLSAAAFRSDGKPCPPFKLVILDEADSMTPSAQAALRRTMEKQTKTTRFCLICNYVSRIIEPLTSRCSKFRFKPLDSGVLDTRLKDICDKEQIKYEDQAIQEIIRTSEGDMRKAITFLQSAHRLKGDAGIYVKDVIDIAGVIPGKMISDLFEACRSDSYEKLEGTVKPRVCVEQMSYDSEKLTTQMQSWKKSSNQMHGTQHGHSQGTALMKYHRPITLLETIQLRQQDMHATNITVKPNLL